MDKKSPASNGLSLPCAARISSSVTFLLSSLSLYPYSTLPKHGALADQGRPIRFDFFFFSLAHQRKRRFTAYPRYFFETRCPYTQTKSRTHTHTHTHTYI